MTTKQVAQQLGVSPSRVRELYKQKRLVGKLQGNVILFEPESVYGFAPKANGRPRKR